MSLTRRLRGLVRRGRRDAPARWLAVRLIPPDVWAELSAAAERRLTEGGTPKSRAGAVAVVLTWLALAALPAAWAADAWAADALV